VIVVADTSPVGYLILIEQIEILPKLYGSVVLPQAVHDELSRPSAPVKIRSWMDHAPNWLEVRTPVQSPAADLAELDAGERDAILLAKQMKADRLLLDEKQGRREATRLGIVVTGTLGVLRDAAVLGLLDLRTAIDRLQSTTFRISPDVLAALLKER